MMRNEKALLQCKMIQSDHLQMKRTLPHDVLLLQVEHVVENERRLAWMVGCCCQYAFDGKHESSLFCSSVFAAVAFNF